MSPKVMGLGRRSSGTIDPLIACARAITMNRRRGVKYFGIHP
ncbi:MAG: hypothetical protein O3A51_09165 [Verrucomicrobia bacterium]|nr:hypothetical protein [Verrucomicrobiota bacterium]